MLTFNKITRYGSGYSKDFRQASLLPVNKPKSGFNIMNIIGDKNYLDIRYRYFNPSDGSYERFINVNGYKDEYLISDWGRIISLKYKPKIMKVDISGEYVTITLSKNNVKSKLLIHRLVGFNFIPNPDNFPIINHEDCNKRNNYYKNLKWCTYSYNIKHSYLNGLELPTSGEKHGMHKLNECEVLEIAKLIRENNFTQEEIASKFNVTRGAIKDIKLMRTWGCLSLNFDNKKWVGENTKSSLLKDDDIPKIRAMILNNISDTQIGKLYNVHRRTINDIRRNKTWKHIKR